MTTLLLAVDVGNTNVSLGIFDYAAGEGELAHHWRLSTHREQTSDEVAGTLRSLFSQSGCRVENFSDVILCSVVPPLQPIWERVCREAFRSPPDRDRPRNPRTGMPVRYENPREVGADRIVNAVAAFELVGGPVVAVDFGTATTFDCVSERGEYLGGAIFPGIHISMESLFERASMLHRVEIARPRTVIGGRRLPLCSRVCFWIRGHGRCHGVAYSAGAGGEVRVIATGGLAQRIASETESIERVEPFLTLEGLRILFEKNSSPSRGGTAKGEVADAEHRYPEHAELRFDRPHRRMEDLARRSFLHAAGATSALGKVDDGSSVLDHTPEEKERHNTLTSSLYGFGWNDLHITLVDTPGDPNFQGDGQVALHALDGAILLVSAVGGIEVGTESMWRASERSGTPLLAFVNGIDRDRADLQGALESLRRMGANPIEVVLPIGSGSDLKGVVDLVRMKATVDGQQAEVPAELAEEVEAARQRLVEAVAETDDELLERYLEEGELDDQSLARVW